MPNKEFRPTLIEILEAQQALMESLFDLEAADAMLVFTSDHFLNVKVMRLINALDLIARFTDTPNIQAQIQDLRARALSILPSLQESPGHHSRDN